MILRLQVSAAGDTAFPRDRFVITPHFATLAGLTDADALCNDLAVALAAWCNDPREFTVKAYDAQGTVPVNPIGTATVNVGLTPPSQSPREVACCLSFFSGFNRPSQRGRLYIPHTWRGGATPVRPTATFRDQIGTLAPIFEGLGGPDIDWVIFSRKNNAALPVTHWYVDDEWDTIRSRGLRATTRTSGTTSEA